MYLVRTCSGAEYRTEATEPATAINNRHAWKYAVTLVEHETGHEVTIAADAIESVTKLSEDVLASDDATQVMNAVRPCTVPGAHSDAACNGYHAEPEYVAVPSSFGTVRNLAVVPPVNPGR